MRGSSVGRHLARNELVVTPSGSFCGLVGLHGLENVSLVVRHVKAFQQLDVFFVEALASMMLLLILNVADDSVEL